jgi:hypothetical protein
VLLALLVVGRASAAPDTSPPIIQAIITGPPGDASWELINGWYTANTTVGWTYQDPESGIKTTEGCDVETVDTEPGHDVDCTATNNAGIKITVTIPIGVDKSPPQIALSATRTPDANGWYNHPVEFAVSASDAASGVDEPNCDVALPPYSGPDRTGAKVTVTCRDNIGRQSRKSVTFDYDGTKPSIRVVPARPPDRYGWYSRPVRISFAGKDAVSHMDQCTSQMYGRPNTARASVTGWCRDRAGNTRTRTFRFRFSSPLLEPRRGMRVSSPPLLDWVSVPRARGYNVQLWHDGRKILSRWPTGSQLRLDGRWSYQGRMGRLARGESYTWYVWPRFRHGYGKMLGSSRFAFVRGSSRTITGLS